MTSPSSCSAGSSKYTDNNNRTSDSSLTTSHDFGTSDDIADDLQPIDLSLKKQNDRIRFCNDNRTMQLPQRTNENYNDFLMQKMDSFPMLNFPIPSSMRGYSPWHHYMCASPLSFIPPSSLPNWNPVSSIGEMIMPMNPLLYGLPMGEVSSASVAKPSYYETSQHLWKSLATAGRADASLFRKFVATHEDAYAPKKGRAAPMFPNQELYQVWNQHLKRTDDRKSRTDLEKELVDDQVIPQKISARVKKERDINVHQYFKNNQECTSAGRTEEQSRSTDQQRYVIDREEGKFLIKNEKYYQSLLF